MRKCSCGKMFRRLPFAHEHDRTANPDYAADPRLVLREINRIGKLLDFIGWLYAPAFHKYRQVVEIKFVGELVDYILDRTGKLRDAAIEWFEKEAK